MHGPEVPKRKPAVDFRQKMRSLDQQVQVTNKPVQGYAGKIGTVNDSYCSLAKLPLVIIELMVFQGTADGGGNTCALESIILTGNETSGAETRNDNKLALPN